MIKHSRLSAALVTSFILLLAHSAAAPDCSAQDSDVYFISDGDFNSAANWGNGLVPSLVITPPKTVPNVYGIDDGHSATFASGTTTVQGLRVGSGAKEHQFGDTHFGRLTMTGGSLEVIGTNELAVGREREPIPFGGDYNKNSIVDAADYTVWRDTLGSELDLRADGDNNGRIEQADYDFWKARFGNRVKGGEIMMTGSSNLTANGMVVGERTKALLSVGPNAVVDLKKWFVVDETYGDPPITIVGPHFSPINTEDMRIGNYGPAYQQFIEPGLDGNGLVDVQGTLNANTMYLSENGAKGEIRVSGGTVDLNGALIMSFCQKCVSNTTDANKARLALQSSKVSIIGSGGTFNVGLDRDPMTPDPNLIINAPFSRDIRSNLVGTSGYPMTATFSFTADAGGVTPITVVDNGLDSSGTANLSGTAYIAGTKLELNLDAYASASPLTLINAAPGHLHSLDEFGTVTFLSSRTATVVYDYANGDVRLINFQGGAGSGALASVAVPEPSGLAMMLTLGLLLFTLNAGANRQRARLWGHQCLKIRA